MTENSPPPQGRTPDPVLFGTDPFPEPPGLFEDEEHVYTRPAWPKVTIILLLVIMLVGAGAVWIF